MLEPGQIFAARYRVTRRIAEGGMGAIFEAQHMATERRVALKLLFPHIMSVASARKKFELEAKISARVNSRNIVEVLDAGFDEATQSPFLVMELLEGLTLAQHVREQGPLGFNQALPLLAQIALGLDAAHGYREANGTPKPIVHRDLKPENLLLARDHGSYVVKILDYGIAKVLGETGNVSQEVRGTPLYMAFEQVTAGALSPQTDVWALGLIAYYMLTGSHYWRSASAASANVQSLFAEILTLPLEAPSLRLRQQHSNVELPSAFDAWLLTCIQRDPTRRFASAGAAIEALSQGGGGMPKRRPRESKPAPPPAFNATEAFETPPEGSFPERLVTTGSLPAVASERSSAPAPAHGRRRRIGLPALAASGALLLTGSTWLALRSGEAGPVGSSSAASTVERPEGDGTGANPRLPELPSPPGAPISMPSASNVSPPPQAEATSAVTVADVQTPKPEPPDPPAVTPGPASTAAATAAPTPPTRMPEPHIGIAPGDDGRAPAAPLEARTEDDRPHAPSEQRTEPARATPIATALPAPTRAATPMPAARVTPASAATPAPATPGAASGHRPNEKPARTNDAYRMR